MISNFYLFWVQLLGCVVIQTSSSLTKMSCGASIPNNCKVGGKGRKRHSIIEEVAVFMPTIHIPVDSDAVHPLRGLVSKELVDCLSKLLAHVISLAEEIYTSLSLCLLDLNI
ncbi:hypothetical protein ABZP36_032482 [Zizania latifolia]